MIHPHQVAEIAAQPVDGLRGECYLGQQEEHLLAFADGIGHELDINLRLARGGDTVEQRHGFLAMAQIVVSRLLLGIEADAVGAVARNTLFQSRLKLLLLLEHPVAKEGLERRLGDLHAVGSGQERTFRDGQGTHLAHLNILHQHIQLLLGILLLLKRIEQRLDACRVLILGAEGDIR